MTKDPAQIAYAAEKKRLGLAATLGKPDALSGSVLTIRMIETIIEAAAQSAASRAATEALRDEVEDLRFEVKQLRRQIKSKSIWSRITKSIGF